MLDNQSAFEVFRDEITMHVQHHEQEIISDSAQEPPSNDYFQFQNFTEKLICARKRKLHYSEQLFNTFSVYTVVYHFHIYIYIYIYE